MKMHKVRLNIVATLDYSTITNTLTIKIVYCGKKIVYHQTRRRLDVLKPNFPTVLERNQKKWKKLTEKSQCVYDAQVSYFHLKWKLFNY